MEFLLISSPNLEEAHAAALRKALSAAPLLAPVDGPLGFFDHQELFVAANGHQSTDIVTVCTDGHGIAGDFAFSAGCGAHLPIDKAGAYIDACLDKANGSDLRGVFTMMRFNPHTKAFTVVTDPLSQYPVLLCPLGPTMIVSNSAYLIEAAASALGHRPTKSARTGAYEAAFGIGAGVGTGHREVILLPHGKLITGLGPNWRIVDAAPQTITQGLSYGELLALSADRLTESVQAIAKSARGAPPVFDLTGGLDSRLVFAAAVAAGIDDLTVFSGGADDSTDKCIAHLIGKTYGARRAALPGNHAGNPVTHQTLAKRAVFRQQGMSNLYRYALGSLRTPALRRVRGGGGEGLRTFGALPSGLFWCNPIDRLLRVSRGEPVYNACLSAYWASPLNRRRKEAVRWALRYCDSPRSHHRLYRPAFLRGATRHMIDSLQRTSRGSTSMGTDLYLADRSRRHFGYLSRTLNLSCGAFEPLLDPVLVAAADALPLEERAAGMLTFDLIERLAGRDMLKIPFAAGSLAPPLRRALARRLKVKPHALVAPPGTLAALEENDIDGGTDANLEGEGAPPAGLGPVAQALWHNRDYFLVLAAALPKNAECWQYFARDTLIKSLKADDYFLRNETTATRGLRIMHTLMWVAGELDPIGIEMRL